MKNKWTKICELMKEACYQKYFNNIDIDCPNWYIKHLEQMRKNISYFIISMFFIIIIAISIIIIKKLWLRGMV